MIKGGNGSAMLKTVQGENLTIKLNGKAIMVTDENGGTAIFFRYYFYHHTLYEKKWI